MEEEVGIKVTRLRRRLSVEAEDVKSPSTQSTPTKKRGGRLAAKPQLELIDENASEAAPKRTRKSTVKETTEPVEEKAVTPARRSARVRSNTSIVSETPGDVAEDKGTPSRRSTRIKSNTSIIAETVQNVNSPRAKRAARRTSQVGSDNEAPVTPARQTRRTRKDSSSSIDKPAEPTAGKLSSQVKEVIVEESENNVKETKSIESGKTDSPIRKSPRLVGKSGRNSSSLDIDSKEIEPQNDKDASETTAVSNKSLSEAKPEQTHEIADQKSEQNDISATSKNLIKELEEAPKKGKNNLNKSTTAIEEPQIKTKRNRTKSWTTISVESRHENSFCSDSEATKKRNKKKNNTLNLSNISGSGDGIMISNKNDEVNKEQNNVSLNSSTLSNKKKKKRHEMSMTIENETSVHEISELNTSVNKTIISDAKEVSKDINDEINSSKKQDSIQKLFQQAPSSVIQSLVFIEDSDSNPGSIVKENIDKGFDSGDQCVPVVDHCLEQNETSKEPENNLSYEPMDIDETMPENVSLSAFTDKNNSVNEDQEPKQENRKSMVNISQVKNDSMNKSKRKSVISNVVSENSIDEASNKSQRKSSISEMIINDVGDANISKRKSSISKVVSEDTMDGIIRVSNRKSLVDDIDNQNKSINKKSNNSKRKSSISNDVIENNIEEDSNYVARKSLCADIPNDESMLKESNKSKRKSSISNIVSDDNTNENYNKFTRKSVVSDQVKEENMDKSLNKSKRKSSVTAMVAEVSMDKIKTSILDPCNDDDMVNKSSNKSKRNSSIIVNDNDSIDKNSDKSKNKSAVLQSLDTTENQNKSTLVLSQIKDVSENDINVESNVPKDNNETNEYLSKSINVPNVNTEKESDKKNLSLTYSTSTPLQQKSIKKLGLQINSSIIAPNSVSKMEKKDTLNTSKKGASVMSQEDESDFSEEEEESEDESSLKKSKLIDDEAEEASDDYESGDSRDDDEKDYEEQHEIIEKGETLDSEDEDEYSDDSDYEKGSFIVSSDDEDNDLLSGSGDDLDLSAEELSMSAKSKKKFNERKIKEQKKASREMFEARHKLNESDKSATSTKPKSKKNNRQRFDSSSSESDDEVTAQPKKNRRQRIDSSQDISMLPSDADKSLSKKKKAKRLSESVCEENATNEKEITIREENQTDKVDPLMLHNVIKEEPKTPQKELNISTVAVTNMDEVEEVNVDENVSMIKSNQTSDPLQATVVDNDSEDNADEDSISENEEITQNFESVLSHLNKSGSKKIKSLDISLDLNKKTKQKAKEPIVDQLNLTQVKKSKKKKADPAENAAETKTLNKSLGNKSIDKVDKQANTFSEGSSDSIDMKLLFPEDSNDSEVVIKENEKQDTMETSQKEDVQENFIPLKRTPGKTNILENTDMNKSKDESILNLSSKKKNKRKSLQTEEALAMSPSTQKEDNLGFFIDTTGTLSDINKVDANTSIKKSAKKNKQKNNVSFTNIEEAIVDDNSNDAPLEISYRIEKNKSKQDLNMSQNNDGIQADSTVLETPNKSAKKKKKNKKGLNSSQNDAEISIIKSTDDVAEKANNISVASVDGSGKKKKKRMSESQIEQETENVTPAEPIQNISLDSAKKLKQKTISESTEVETENVNKDNEDVINQQQITKKRKRKSSANQTIDEIVIKDDVKLTQEESITTNNQKKKRKISNNGEDVKAQFEDSVAETQEQEKPLVENTKKKSKVQQYQEVDEIGDEATKKNKKRKERDDDDASKISKVFKQNSFDKVHVPRLPANVIKQLDDKAKKDVVEIKKTKAVSTSTFVVEETKTRRHKPSNYLEESVYLNNDFDEKKQKGAIKNPKVLPFIPTASTSDSGFTTNFKVNVISQQTQFVAQSSGISNFKNDYLHKKRIKKLGTFEMYKRQRNIKISKF